MIDRQVLHQALDALLEPQRFKDYCPNGLQVEGRSQVRKVVAGVTASLALVEAAAALGADTLLVHHGLFWRGQDGCVTGWMRARLALLLQFDINLFAYHLPLDDHADLGNNAQLAAHLGLQVQSRFGEQGLGWMGVSASGPFDDASALARHVEAVLGRDVLLVPGKSGQVRKIGWCSGGAQGFFEEAIRCGADAFITGEISEPQAHYARECGVAYLACGHHATERFGVRAVAEHVCRGLGLECAYVEINNPA
jgi:dinuclear metal center YbgI/SA1388 family protein